MHTYEIWSRTFCGRLQIGGVIKAKNPYDAWICAAAVNIILLPEYAVPQDLIDMCKGDVSVKVMIK